jgi:hypothetical protein
MACWSQERLYTARNNSFLYIKALKVPLNFVSCMPSGIQGALRGELLRVFLEEFLKYK